MMGRGARTLVLSGALGFVAAMTVAAPLGVNAAAVSTPQPAGGNEELARRHYETGLAFLRDGRYQEALKDFQAVADNYPASAVADQALLQIATYQFEQAHDTARAASTIDQLLRVYPTGRAAPFAYLLSGRLAVAAVPRNAAAGGAAAGSAAGARAGGGAGAARSPQLDAALASFERARRLFPVPEVMAAAGYYSGEALRTAGRCADALDAYQDVIADYPRLAWAARAELGLGRCLVSLDRAREAMPHLQRVRRGAGQGAPADEAVTAIRWNTILGRLLVRTPEEPAFTFAGRAVGDAAKPVRDVVSLAVARDGRIAILTEQALVVHGAQGAVVESFAVRDPRGLALDAAGQPIVVLEHGLLRARTALQPLRTAASGSAAASAARPLDELSAAAALASGELLAADRRTRTIHRFDADGQHRGVVATTMSVSRMAANDQNEIVALERESRAVVMLDAGGAAPTGVPRRLAPRGDGYQLDEPVDVAIDALGHIYVLDRRQAAVLVFGKDGRLLATLRSPDTGEGTFRQPSALALDHTGRVYVHDERQRHVVIYQ